MQNQVGIPPDSIRRFEIILKLYISTKKMDEWRLDFWLEIILFSQDCKIDFIPRIPKNF